MDKLPVENPALARTLLAGIASECPRRQASPTCHLVAIRKLPYVEKKSWLKSLDNAALMRIYSEHCRCLASDFAEAASC